MKLVESSNNSFERKMGYFRSQKILWPLLHNIFNGVRTPNPVARSNP